MNRALIGHTGFVGSNLARQSEFEHTYHSKTINGMRGRTFDLVVCAGLPAAKWIANRDPEGDQANMHRLRAVLDTVTTERFVLVSTIDVYARLSGCDEADACGDDTTRQAYGRHRCQFERFVESRFAKHNIVRLPALFGAGLKKNVIFDLQNHNRLEHINPLSSFQWYWVERLWADIETITRANLPICNVFTEPVPTAAIAARFFPAIRLGSEADPEVHYNLRTRHAAVFESGTPGYAYDREQVMRDLDRYVTGVVETRS